MVERVSSFELQVVEERKFRIHALSHLFSILGVTPALGRFFTEQDDRRGAAATVVLTNGLWQRRYASDPAIVGKTILLDAQKYTVIGVLPAWFDYPDARVQLWVPARLVVSETDMRNRGNHRFYVTARLKDGVTVEQASSELDGIQQRNHLQFPDELMGKGARTRCCCRKIWCAK